MLGRGRPPQPAHGARGEPTPGAPALFGVEYKVVLLAPASDPHGVDAVWLGAPQHPLISVRVECKVVLPAPASGCHFQPAVWFWAQQRTAMLVAEPVREHRGGAVGCLARFGVRAAAMLNAQTARICSGGAGWMLAPKPCIAPMLT